MPNPKRKLSNAKRHKRRTHHVIKPPVFATCPRCKQPKVPHRVCGNCGYYSKDKEVVKV